MLLPALVLEKKAQRISCGSNLRFITRLRYADDQRDALPPKFEIKKNTLNAEDLPKEKELQTLTNGLHTTLVTYVGSSTFTTSASPNHNPASHVFRWRWDFRRFCQQGAGVRPQRCQLRGRGIRVKPQKEGDEEKNRFSLAATRDIARDLFKPWDADEPLRS